MKRVMPWCAILALSFGACKLELPSADCTVPDGIRLDCGAVDANVKTECRDGNLDAIVTTIPPPAEQHLRLCLDGPMRSVRTETPCELPGPQYARRVRASVGASCERRPANPGSELITFRLTIEAAIERACHVGGQLGSAAGASPRWEGAIVAPDAQRYLLRVDVYTTHPLADCTIQVGDRNPCSARGGDGGQNCDWVLIDGPTTVPAVIDCRSGDGLLSFTCYDYFPDTIEHPGAQVERLIVDFVFQRRPQDGGV